ncbi:MAG: HIT domain-containing protein [Planctomycetia bacterium]|nr:HIT domain-containing protein [Planctomycetia bacterium]
MGYQEIWAPWRMAYIASDENEGNAEKKEAERENALESCAKLDFLPGADESCFICQAAADSPQRDKVRHVVLRGENVLVIMNKFPYNNGHLLVTPRRHCSRLDMLTSGEMFEISQTMVRMIALLEKTMGPEGFNVGLNLGSVAGAGLPGHVHWHIVPRWNGDTNFMPVLACVNVIPQSLDALWEALRREIER